MIIARKVNLSDENDVVKSFIPDYEHNDIIFILEENKTIIGISKIKPLKEVGLLQQLFIQDEKRGQGYGDGLLRAILNYCLRNNIREVYHLSIDEYLLGKGFRTIDTGDTHEEIVKYITGSLPIKCDLNEFFSQSCCNKRS